MNIPNYIKKELQALLLPNGEIKPGAFQKSGRFKWPKRSLSIRRSCEVKICSCRRSSPVVCSNAACARLPAQACALSSSAAGPGFLVSCSYSRFDFHRFSGPKKAKCQACRPDITPAMSASVEPHAPHIAASFSVGVTGSPQPGHLIGLKRRMRTDSGIDLKSEKIVSLSNGAVSSLFIKLFSQVQQPRQLTFPNKREKG